MDPSLADETPTAKDKDEPEPLRAMKSYATPKLTQHGELPPLTLGGSLTDA